MLCFLSVNRAKNGAKKTNKPPAMQVCSQKALASRKNLHVIMSLRFANQIQYNKEVSEWIITVYHTQNGHANII